jgi:hypothetical protein
VSSSVLTVSWWRSFYNCNENNTKPNLGGRSVVIFVNASITSALGQTSAPAQRESRRRGRRRRIVASAAAAATVFDGGKQHQHWRVVICARGC